MKIKINEEMFKVFLHVASERQNIFYARLRQERPPWTEDEILRNHKFTNAYRASDRVSQYLIKNVIYADNYSDADTLMRIFLFKFFNKIETWQYLESLFHDICVDSWDYEAYAEAINRRLISGGRPFSAAYIMSGAKSMGQDKKHENYLTLVDKVIRTKFHLTLKNADSYYGVYQILKALPLFGDFIAMQMLTDLNYSDLIDFSENDMIILGPGAWRGMAKLTSETGYTYEEAQGIIYGIVENQYDYFKRFDIEFNDLFGRPLSAMDVQNLLCEFDKYTRVSHPQYNQGRSRIKQKYRYNDKKPIRYFYPPKWGINELVKSYQSEFKRP